MRDSADVRSQIYGIQQMCGLRYVGFQQMCAKECRRQAVASCGWQSHRSETFTKNQYEIKVSLDIMKRRVKMK